VGLPLVCVLLDASETNFSGFRGAVNQAKIGWRRNQRAEAARLHVPAIRCNICRWMLEDPLLARASERSDVDIFNHRWGFPVWEYTQPVQDSAAALLQLRNGLTSGRRRAAADGVDYEVLSTEIVEDNAAMITKAHEKAEELNKTYPGLNLTWRELASLPTPDGVQIALNPAGDGTPGPGKK
jgi:hypothetical protein